MIDGQESDHSLIGDILTSRGCNLLEVTNSREALRFDQHYASMTHLLASA
jgi:hypothetical protein